jgi:hypothetical protein
MKLSKYISILVLIATILVSFKQPPAKINKLSGHVYDIRTQEPLPFTIVEILVNDSLQSFTSTDFDGAFTVETAQEISQKDKIELKVLFLENSYTKILSIQDFKKNIKIEMEIDEVISLEELLKWRRDFFNNLPNYKECIIIEEVDELELKEK